MVPTIDAALLKSRIAPPRGSHRRNREPADRGATQPAQVGLADHAKAARLRHRLSVGTRLDTFAAIAEQAPAEVQFLSAIADALQGQVYAQNFARRYGRLARGRATAHRGDRCVRGGIAGRVNGSADRVWGVYEQQLPRRTNPRVPDPLSAVAARPSVLAVGACSASPPLTKEELFALEPLYLR